MHTTINSNVNSVNQDNFKMGSELSIDGVVLNSFDAFLMFREDLMFDFLMDLKVIDPMNYEIFDRNKKGQMIEQLLT